jgi:3-hydroxyisobutyrate dehydrogenase
MGRPMARNLMKSGHSLVVHNRSRAVVDELAAEGARAGSSPAEVAASCDVLFTCLTTPDVVQQVMAEAARGGRPGQIFVDHSTIGASDARRIAALLSQQGIRFLDCPVSGGPWGAEQGTLAIMCGGEKEAFEAVRPLLEAMGRHIFHLGGHGAGSIAKLCNQMLVAVSTVAAAEAFVLGTKAGLDPRAIYDVLAVSTGFSRTIERHMEKFVFPGNFEAAFSVSHMHKDIGLANQLGREANVRLLTGAVTLQLFEEAVSTGYAQHDIAALFRPLEQIAGVEVRSTPAGR